MDTEEHARSPLDEEDITESSAAGMASGDAHAKGKKKVLWSLPVDGEDTGREEKLDELEKSLSLALPEANRPVQDRSKGELSVPSRGVLRNSGSSTPQIEIPNVDDGVTDLDYKRRSATDAHSRASRLNEDVSRGSSPTRRKTGHRHQQSPFKPLWYQSQNAESGQTTPDEPYADCGDAGDRVPSPRQYRVGGLSALLMGSKYRGGHSRQGSQVDYSTQNSPTRSPSRSPYDSPRNSVFDLVASSTAAAGLASKGAASLAKDRRPGLPRSTSEDTLTGTARPSFARSASSSFIDLKKLITPGFGSGSDDITPRIRHHIEDNKRRQRFLIRLCRAFMMYGAPTHRIEEAMKSCARTLEIPAQFLYLPGCMIVSFDDLGSQTAEVKLVRTSQGVDLGKLRDTYNMYKDVVHDRTGVGEAADLLDKIMKRKDKFSVWLRILMFGVASACVGPFAFGARAIDLPIAFFLGLIVGLLQLRLSIITDLYSNLFEILAVLLTSVLSRVFGSLQSNQLFCFPALAQSSIALILPGYTVLCGALELQAKSIIAGSVRLVYAIIYSLFLGFALTLGIALVGVAWPDASSQTVCSTPLSDNGRYIWLFVPPFTLALCIINQAKWKQMPVMLFIAFAGYVVNYQTAARFAGNPQVSSAIGSFVIAVLANIYSRVSFERLVAKMDKDFRDFMQKPAANPTISTEPATPSTLENLSQTTGWRLIMYRILHLGRLPPGHAGSSPTEKEQEAERKSRVQVSYSLAASAMLPAIFVQVPSGLSVSGSLVQGIAQGNQLASNSTGGTLTAGDVYSGRGSAQDVTSTIAFTVGYSVVQVAIGITVGLFLGALLVYPFGKGGKGKRTRGTIFAF